MVLNSDSKVLTEEVRLLNNSTFEESKNFFEALFCRIILNYLDKKPTYIPYLGSFDFKYGGELLTHDGKEAVVTLTFKPDYNLKRNIGQCYDETETDAEKYLQEKFRGKLEMQVNLEQGDFLGHTKKKIL